MDGDRDIGEDRRRANRRDGDTAVAVCERVANGQQLVVRLDVVELEIGEGALVERAPVDDPVVAVDPATLVQVHEETHHGARVVVVEREALAPVVE